MSLTCWVHLNIVLGTTPNNFQQHSKERLNAFTMVGQQCWALFTWAFPWTGPCWAKNVECWGSTMLNAFAVTFPYMGPCLTNSVESVCKGLSTHGPRLDQQCWEHEPFHSQAQGYANNVESVCTSVSFHFCLVHYDNNYHSSRHKLNIYIKVVLCMEYNGSPKIKN